MPGAWTTLSVKDALGNNRTMRAWDESGTGVGPYSFGQFLSDGLGGSLAVTGGVADSGPVIKTGGLAKTANPTAVADAQRVAALFDKLGKQVVVGSIRDLKIEGNITLTASTTETTLLAAAASTFHDLYGLVLTNTSATATEVVIRDATAGGTARSFMVPAGETRGFMLPESAAIKQATVNNNWTAQCTTSVSSIKINAMFVKNI